MSLHNLLAGSPVAILGLGTVAKPANDRACAVPNRYRVLRGRHGGASKVVPLAEQD